MARFLCLIVLSLIALEGSGQTLYRCQEGQKVTYSDRPCNSGQERRLRADGGPTEEDVARARARLSREIADGDAKLAAERDERQRHQRRPVGDMTDPKASTTTSSPNPSENEKVMVHDKSGWEYKTNGQLALEQAVREGREPAATGAAWEGETVTIHGPNGWTTTTRRAAALAEGARLRRQDQRSRSNAVTRVPGSLITDQFGNQYIDQGGTAVSVTTGKTCVLAGNAILNCN